MKEWIWGICIHVKWFATKHTDSKKVEEDDTMITVQFEMDTEERIIKAFSCLEVIAMTIRRILRTIMLEWTWTTKIKN